MSALILRDVSLPKPGTYTVRASDGEQYARDRLDRLRDRSAQGEERDPVHRRRHVARAPRRGAHPRQGHQRRQSARQARHRRHAAYGAGRDRRHRLHHHRFGELDERLHHRSQVGGQCDGRLRRPHARPVRRSQGRKHHQSGATPARHGGRHRHQYRDRGRDAGGDGGAYAAAHRIRSHRGTAFRRQARRHHGRRSGELPPEVGGGLQAQGRSRFRGALPRCRLSGGADGGRDEGGGRGSRQHQAARAVPYRQHGWRARP